MASKAPSLVNLCTGALRDYILYGNDDGVSDDGIYEGIYMLPTELFDCLVNQFPALALHKLQSHMPGETQNDLELEYDCSGNRRKRVRNSKFNVAWKALFRQRWPKSVVRSPVDALTWKNAQECEPVCDWQQMYWQTHIQSCFDAAAERAMLPAFNKSVGEIEIPDVLVKAIGYQPKFSSHPYSTLCAHCQEFGAHLRYLRLQNVLCIAETSNLLTNSKLQGLLLRRISTKLHMEGLCRILSQNRETLTSLEFNLCKISLAHFEWIVGSLVGGGRPTHGLKHFAVKMSKFLDFNPSTLPPKLVSFITSGSLESLSLCDSRIGTNYAKLILTALLNASSAISTLDLSDNNISGWLSDFHIGSASHSSRSQELSRSLHSLHVLNLRGNNLQKNDMEDLRSALVHLPALQRLDLASNPIRDEGIKNLIPYFVMTAGHSHLSDLILNHCKLTCGGTAELLKVLLELEYPLGSLSLADNDLGSDIAPALGDFLRTSVRSLDIRDIDLGSSGCLELRKSMPDTLTLSCIDISENRGGIQAAELIHELISKAPELCVVQAGYNLMPPESLKIIYSAVKIAKGKLQFIDLTGNHKLYQADDASLLSEFQYNGKPMVLLPTLAQNAPYDDDP